MSSSISLMKTAKAGPIVSTNAGNPEQSSVSEDRKNIAGYVAVVAITVAIVVISLRLWRADLTVPFLYQGDNLVVHALVQGMRENGWYLENPRLGMPLPQNMHDFPMADTLHLVILKLMSWVWHDTGLVLNLYSLLCFPLVALSAYYVFRRFKLARLAALVPSVLYACAPYHFCRFSSHLFLAGYYLLPLMTLLLVRLYLGRLPFARTDSPDGSARWNFINWQSAGAVLLCILTGLSGAYYAFFSCFLLLATGIKASSRDRKWAHFLASLLLIAVIFGSAAAALAPSLLYNITHGKNLEVANRLGMEADLYGLNMAEMLLPLEGHHWGVFARLHQAYDFPPRQMTGEHIAVSVGVFASVGFLWLVGRFLWRRRDKTDRVEDGLAYLNIVAVLLATIGGLGSLFSFYVTPMIRCYNRICIWIAFLALFSLALTLQRVVRRRVAGKSRTAFALYSLCALAVLLLGWLDQTIHSFVPRYLTMQKKFHCDADFGKRMEEALPAGAMVYQMPFVSFPEQPPVFALHDYELLRPYLHTRTLRFSYGAMRGREASYLQMALSRRKIPELVRTLAFAGFEGIYLDRAGFIDGAVAVEKQLSRVLGAEPLVSLNQQHVCFDMSRYIRELHRFNGESEWQRERDDALHPVRVSWHNFCQEEVDYQRGYFRWCSHRGELHLFNPHDRPRDVVLHMAYSAWAEKPANLILDGDLTHQEWKISKTFQMTDLKLCVPPGEHVIRFSCDGPVFPNGDPRSVVFRVWNVDCRFAE